jgi:transposase InsO family protein
MDIVGGLDSFPLTPRGHRYILTMIDCFTRYGIAVPLIDQSAEVVIASVIHHYITVYGTPRRILTDQGRNFESDQFAKFCLLFRISKIRTTAYHPQSNGICERFNQTLKNSLAKILSKDQQNSWDLYLNFAVFSYNLSIHSSTGFTPFFLTFGTEARLPPDIIFGSPVSTSSNLDSTRKTNNGSISFLFDSFSLLSGAFAQVRENLKSFHQREKDRYDLGAIERVFHAGDRVRVRIKSRQKGHAKFLSEW